MTRIITCFLAICFAATTFAQLQSPAEFLGYELGERFTRHADMLDYVEHAHQTVAYSKLIQYGETYERRPLKVFITSSAENMSRLEEIRANNLKKVNGESTNPELDQIALVWLSYNVHGNESSCLEAAMQVVYEASNVSNKTMQKWLENVVLIVDPCINPDGRDRYANFYNQYGNTIPNPDIQSKEHHEPWPGGRYNHYLFDLNRDWAWQTQQESQQRIVLYQQWMPHVHADFHEQGYNRPYYFAPAAEPYHKVITDWQREFQQTVGNNNAKYFDKRGEIYFTKEDFDLLYPSYGDTYPIYHGAIGMTYEQGGSGVAGLLIETETGDSLSLSLRVQNHVESSLSAIEVASINSTKLAAEFARYFKQNREAPWGTYKAYLIPSEGNEAKLDQLCAYLDRNGIEYGKAPANRKLTGYEYESKKQVKVTTGKEDLLISAYQPQSSFLNVLFDPNPTLSDTLTYDITSWAIPYAYGLKAYALSGKLEPSGDFIPVRASNEIITGEAPYAYVVHHQNFADMQFLAALQAQKVGVRMAEEPFTIKGNTFERGAMVILKKDNSRLGNKLNEIVAAAATETGTAYVAVQTGMVDKGFDFGSDSYRFISPPKVAVLGGSGVSAQAFGEFWHFFEQELKYPLTVLEAERLHTFDLEKYDVLVIPNGYYSNLDSVNLAKMANWTRGGGNLIVMGNALRSFAKSRTFALQKYEDKEAEKKQKEFEKLLAKTDRFDRYTLRNRNSVREETPGAVYRVSLDHTHPLFFGYHDAYLTLKTSGMHFPFLTDGWNVGYMQSTQKPLSGFTGSRAQKDLENTLVFGVEDMGRGHVVYMVDNPLFRSFWQNGKMLMANAIFFVGAK
jgi:hypothetical protein